MPLAARPFFKPSNSSRRSIDKRRRCSHGNGPSEMASEEYSPAEQVEDHRPGGAKLGLGGNRAIRREADGRVAEQDAQPPVVLLGGMRFELADKISSESGAGTTPRAIHGGTIA